MTRIRADKTSKILGIFYVLFALSEYLKLKKRIRLFLLIYLKIIATKTNFGVG
jgi:hypothetical protein